MFTYLIYNKNFDKTIIPKALGPFAAAAPLEIVVTASIFSTDSLTSSKTF